MGVRVLRSSGFVHLHWGLCVVIFVFFLFFENLWRDESRERYGSRTSKRRQRRSEDDEDEGEAEDDDDRRRIVDERRWRRASMTPADDDDDDGYAGFVFLACNSMGDRHITSFI